ncbi:MAG: hypothetical protein ACR2HN_12005 [Tepidiformaceae bacterium]
MFTKMSADFLLEGVIISLTNDIMPELQSQRAQVVVAMMQGILQTVRQRLPVEQQIMAAEHNEMTAMYREVAAILGDATGGAAGRVRERAAALGARDDMAPVPAFEAITGPYHELSEGIISSLFDLDELIRDGDERGEKALLRVRRYLGPRYTRDYGTMVAAAGMVGRG